MTTEDLDRIAEAFIRSHEGAKPSFKGLYGFPKTPLHLDQRGDRPRHPLARSGCFGRGTS